MTTWNICHKSGRVLFTTNDERTAMNRAKYGWRVKKVDDLKCILNEMRSYNPKADEYGGKFIIPGWADRIEKALIIELPERLSPEGYHIDEAYLVPDPDGDYLDRDKMIDVLNKAGVKHNG